MLCDLLLMLGIPCCFFFLPALVCVIVAKFIPDLFSEEEVDN